MLPFSACVSGPLSGRSGSASPPLLRRPSRLSLLSFQSSSLTSASAAAEWSEEEAEEEVAWGQLTPLSAAPTSCLFRPPTRAARSGRRRAPMLPLSASFSGTEPSAAQPRSPDSPWRRFPTMLANQRSGTNSASRCFNFDRPTRPAVRSASHGLVDRPAPSPGLLTPTSGSRRLLAPPGPVLLGSRTEALHRFVRSVSCEMGDLAIGKRRESFSSLSSLNLTQLMRFKKEFRIQRRHSQRLNRRSFHAGASPVLPPRCHSPSNSHAGPSGSSGSGHHHPPRLSAQLHHYHGSGSGSYTGLPFRPSSSAAAAHHRSAALALPDTRRWSLASLPSSSGYGTPGSSAFSSQYSSTERLAAAAVAAEEEGRGRGRTLPFGSPESEELARPSAGHTSATPTLHSNLSAPALLRPRSRSLGSPTKFLFECPSDTLLKNNVYKERFPKAKSEMEERLSAFVEREEEERSGVSDGSTRFLLRQLIETAAECLGRSREDRLSSAYFLSLNDGLNELLIEAKEKAPSSVDFLSGLIRELLLIVARPARLLECLEFNPEEFYAMLELAEGQVRSQFPDGATIPDFPQYIVEKLGLAQADASLDSSLNSSDAAPSDAPLTRPSPLPHHRLSWTESLLSSTDSGLPTAGVSAGVANVDEDDEGWRKNSDASSIQEKAAAALFAQRPPVEEDFETIKLISNGAYGAVWLVRHTETRERFALKKLSKRNVMLRNQVEQVFAERDILTFANNPFVVSFYGSFETKTHLCMVMEYVEGGDCASLLKAVGVLPVETAKPYIAEAVLAIEYLHSYGIVHRDLKPDNLLITAMGHVKLTDFGLSKIGLMNRTTLYAEGALGDAYSETHQFQDQQLIGTPEYIAPECILRQGYGKPVDWWALGIITYEFLVGTVPFLGETPDQLFLSIIQEDIQWGDEEDDEEAIDPEAKDLVSALLIKNPVDRLGGVLGAEEVKAHPFFADVDYRTILKQKAEFIPQLDSEEDTSYFDTRTDRYNHEESDGEADSPGVVSAVTLREERSAGSLYWANFSSPSPRHSLVGGEGSGPLYPPARAQSSLDDRLKAAAEDESAVDSAYSVSEGSGGGRSRASSDVQAFARSRILSSCSGSGAGSSGGTGSLPESSQESTARPPLLSVPPVHGEAPPPTDGEPGNRRRTQTVPLPRFAISCESESGHEVVKELSPVEEKSGGAESAEKRKSTTGQISPSQRNRASSLRKAHGPLLHHHPVVSKSSSLHLVIPSSPPPGGGGAVTLVSSPGASSNSSRDDSPSRAGLPGILSLKPPVMLRKGAKGYGFTIRSVRVYIGENSEFYTIQHMISHVDPNSPAFEAGLRPDELITHVHGEPVQNLTHPQLMQRLFSFGDTISLRTTPLDQTSIRVGGARKSAGKMLRKKGRHKLQRRVLESKKRKASLLRRLSGKRTGGDPTGASGSGQKPPLLPRSVSSQEALNPPPTPPPVGQPLLLTRDSPSSSSSCSSPVGGSSSSSHSPAFWQSHRPSSLHGLRTKLAATILKSPARRNPSATMPLSPLARVENAEAPLPLAKSSPPTSPPPPLALAPESQVSGPAPAAVKKTITKPRKSSDLGGSDLLRAALDRPAATQHPTPKGPPPKS